MVWKCKACEVKYETSHDVDHDDPRVHNVAAGKIECPNGHGQMLWEPAVHSVRAIDATFDYTFQVFRNCNGDAIESKENWDFSCPRCLGPAKLTSCSAWAENHRCHECKHEFEVK